MFVIVFGGLKNAHSIITYALLSNEPKNFKYIHPI